MRNLAITFLFIFLPQVVFAAAASDNTWKLKYPEIGGVVPYIIKPTIDSVLSDGTSDPRIEKELTSDQRALLNSGIHYYRDHSPIRFVNVRRIPGGATEYAPYDPIFISPAPGAGSKAYWGPAGSWFQPDAYLRIGDNADMHSIIHEFMHTLGFFHEQQRPDRNDYLFLVTSGLSSDQLTNNYNNNQNSLMPQKIALGNFDFDSIMLYESERISYKIPANEILEWVSDQATPAGKYLRIKLVDSTPLDLADNPALHNERGLAKPDVYSADFGWRSAQWSIENIDGYVFFNIKNRHTGEYLYAVSGTVVENRSSIAPSDPKAQWELIVNSDGSTKIVNRQYGTHLAKNAMNVAVLTSTPYSTTSHWILEPMVLERRQKLSIGDLLAINIAYDFPVSFSLANDPDNRKIHTIGQNGSGYVPKTESIPLAPGAFLPRRAQWQLIKVGGTNDPYIAIRNVDSGLFLLSGSGNNVFVNPVSNLESLTAAHWRMEFAEGFFQIKSRASGKYIYTTGQSLAQSNVAYTSDSSWRIDAEIKHIFQTGFIVPYSEGKTFQMILSSTLNSSSQKGAYVSGSDLRVGALDSHALATNTERSRWFFEPVSLYSTKYYRIRNATTGQYLHREYGSLASAPSNAVNGGGAALPQWHSAQWYFDVQETGFYIKNRNTNEYLHNASNFLSLAGSPSSNENLWRLIPNDTANDAFVKQISYDWNHYDEWVPLAERENAFQVVHYVAGQALANMHVLTIENGMLSLQKLVGTTNEQKRRASSWQFFNSSHTAYNIKNAFSNDEYFLGHYPNGLSAQYLSDWPQLANGLEYDDQTANWVLEVYRAHFRIKNLKTNQYLVNNNGSLGMTATPTPLNGNWKIQAINPLPGSSP